MSANHPELIIYQADDGSARVDVRLEGDSVWLTQKQLADLFQTTKQNVGQHIKDIFSDGELEENSVVKKIFTTANDGKNYQTKHYNLDMIVSLGYRINSKIATKFRQWATSRLTEYITKGFTMDDDRLKNLGGGGYWKELSARIRDIRASEKVFYRQILDIYATSIDYDPTAPTSQEFFKKVQNKIHYAVHGNTAAEVIYSRADAEKDFMGLMSFEGNRPHLTDAVVAKNYLDEKELRALGQIVEGYLAFAERQAERQVPMTMTDWAKHLDEVLLSNNEKLLADAGKISHHKAIEKAAGEYRKYQQKTLSDVEEAFLATVRDLRAIEKSVKEKEGAK
jgi:hypothetical protein